MRYPIFLFSLWSCLLTAPVFAADPSPRERLLADFGWRFHLGDEWSTGQSLGKAGSSYGPASPDFSEASWRRVDVPHDWANELPFERKADGSHGFRPVGESHPHNSVGWYRRTFELPKSDAGRRIWLEFDGVFRDSLVFVNGWLVGHHESGYSGFRYDITDVANLGGQNLIAVRVDATRAEGWWYEGAGIYRHVWLSKTAPLAVAPDGVFVWSRFKNNLPVGPAELRLQTRLHNAGREPANATVVWTVLAPDGKPVAKAQGSAKVGAGAEGEIERSVRVGVPELWSPETPRLYRLRTEVKNAGKLVDQVETTFGIRTVAFDADKGFLLNGKPYVIKGTANHQDHAGVGVALPDGLQDFRIAKLKEIGSNAYRSAHNPPTPELLAACDRLGMLVMDENRLLGSDSQNLRRLEALVRRDRNHPSVVMWSVANEEWAVQAAESGGQVATAMQDLVKRLDPSRPVTYAAPMGNEHSGINKVIEVRGWNYNLAAQNMDAYHAAHPRQPNLGTEQGSTVSTRGIYSNDPARGYVSAYDDNAPSWGNTAKQWVGFFSTRPWLSGGFVWTGFDYRGEPTPYSWPCTSSHFGILDTCGFPKDNFWNYQAWWSDKPVLHLVPHWNWPGQEGQEIDVRALSNCDEVELFLDGKSLGKKARQGFVEPSWRVAYRPGTLLAKGTRAGQPVAEARVETTGAAALVEMSAHRSTLDADGRDVALVSVSVSDDKGRRIPTANHDIAFTIMGPGRIIGVGNGDPSSHEPDKFIAVPSVRTRVVDDWRWHKIDNAYAPSLPEVEAKFDDSRWAKADVRSESGPLGLNEKAVFRGRFSLSATDLAAAGIELWFSKIDGGVTVFVNGRKLGRAGDARGPSLYDVKAALRPGENVVAVSLANWGHAAGINKGVHLRLIGETPAGPWRRRVFSGLAQVIVQATHDSGTIKLTAESKGLRSAMLELSSQAPARPIPELRY